MVTWTPKDTLKFYQWNLSLLLKINNNLMIGKLDAKEQHISLIKQSCKE